VVGLGCLFFGVGFFVCVFFFFFFDRENCTWFGGCNAKYQARKVS